MIYPLAQHPTNKNGIIVYDLRYSPEDLIKLSANEIIERLYTPKDQLPEGVARIPIKTIQINKCPVLAPVKTLDEASLSRLDIDQDKHLKHLQMLQAEPGLQQEIKQKLNKVFSHNPFPEETDPDKSLYSGGFFSSADRQCMDNLRHLNAEELATAEFNFQDQRIPEMLFRYRARNYPHSLSDSERSRWDEYRRDKFENKDAKNSLSLESFKQILAGRLLDNQLSDKNRQVLLELQKWGDQIETKLGL